MARIGTASLNTQALIKALLLLALAACLGLPGTARAQQCVDSISDFPADADVMAPDPAIRFAIMDLVSRYNWARDDQVSAGITDLFTSDVIYELCAAGGEIQITSKSNAEDVVAYLGDLTTFLRAHDLRTRHIVSNQMFHQDQDDATRVLGKMTVLVLLQPAYPESPVLDYTATLKAEFKRGADDAWRFSKLTIFGDTPAPGPSGVRGR
jgi:SnoaL-like domain